MDAGAAVLAVLVLAVAAIAVVQRRADSRVRAAEAQLAVVREDLHRERRSSEEASETRNLILASMDDGVLLLDGRGMTAYANRAVDRLLGSAPASTTSLFPLAIRDVVRTAAEGGSAREATVEVGTPARWLRGRATPVGDDGSVLLVLRDVTEARQLDAIRKDFVANASHELKTPAASIRAVAETIRHAAGDDPGAVPRFAGQLEREALRLTRLVEDLLDLSRLESGSDLREPVALETIAREEAERFARDATEAGLSLEVAVGHPASIVGSARDVSLLVRNLVDNAIRYSRPGGTVTVQVDGAPASSILRVRDTGIGIPQRDLTRIFERFYRVDRARSRDTGGTGLGLAIVKHVAENHGATVEVRSELGTGTTVEVVFPVAPSVSPDRSRP